MQTFTPGWNDPPSLSRPQNQSGSSSSVRNLLNKRVAFPISGSSDSNPSLAAMPTSQSPPPMQLGMPVAPIPAIGVPPPATVLATNSAIQPPSLHPEFAANTFYGNHVPTAPTFPEVPAVPINAAVPNSVDVFAPAPNTVPTGPAPAPIGLTTAAVGTATASIDPTSAPMEPIPIMPAAPTSIGPSSMPIQTMAPPPAPIGLNPIAPIANFAIGPNSLVTAPSVENAASAASLSNEEISETLRNALASCVAIPPPTIDNISKRLEKLQAALGQSSLSSACKEKLDSLVTAMKDSKYTDAYNIHSAMMVEHFAEVNQWMVGVKALILECQKQRPAA